LKRGLAGVGLVVAMLAFAIGVYHAAGYLRGDRPVVHRPTEITASPLPGTMYLTQAGAIYRFQHGSFTQVTAAAGWMQPAAGPSGQLVAVRLQPNYSDLYLLSTAGRELSQLTHNGAAGPAENNHWAFYPRLSADGKTVFYDYDPKDPYNSYKVDLAIFASRLSAGGNAVDWTQPNDFTGGDVNPVPLKDGALIYTKYSIDDQSQVHGQIWIQRRPGTDGVALTTPDLGCGQPALAPDEKSIAMVCNKGSNQSADLVVASFDEATLTLGSPSTLVSGQLVASPAFSPDGKTIAFLAPSTPGGGFQLWTANPASAGSVRDITTDLGLDSTSAPVWLAG
jgi:Tol biopolymer transport system component